MTYDDDDSVHRCGKPDCLTDLLFSDPATPGWSSAVKAAWDANPTTDLMAQRRQSTDEHFDLKRAIFGMLTLDVFTPTATIARALGAKADHVSDILRRAERAGYPIEHERGHGYRLRRPAALRCG